MIYRSKAPLRIGLAGGGTDVSPYCDLYGGAILNATLSLYAHATIEPLPEPTIILQGVDRKEEQRFEGGADLETLPIDGTLDLLKGVYNRIRAAYGWPGRGFRLSTFVDAPAGSGLGTSSTLVVAIIGVFTEMLRLPLGLAFPLVLPLMPASSPAAVVAIHPVPSAAIAVVLFTPIKVTIHGP